MRFNKHFDLEGKHAFLGASKYSWTNYTDEKLEATFRLAMAAQRGTELHAFANDAIRLGIKLPRTTKTINLYVNDAIGYRMVPEQILFYSDNAFGTADAISFRKNFLRIHDLKTGIRPTTERQLEVYEALFCLEYGVKPHAIDAELRIYQNDEVRVFIPNPDDIAHIMDKIITFDNRIQELKAEAE